jgi:hypothetical protein
MTLDIHCIVDPRVCVAPFRFLKLTGTIIISEEKIALGSYRDLLIVSYGHGEDEGNEDGADEEVEEETSHSGSKRKATTAPAVLERDSCRSLHKGTHLLCDGVAENKENRRSCSATTLELSRPPRIFGG